MRRPGLTALALVTALILLALTAPADAAPHAGVTYYVATNGNDSNPGTIAAPWRTIQKAANTVEPGSTVQVRGGVYNERVRINVSGTAADGAITFVNYPGERAIIDGAGLRVRPDADALVWIQDRSYITFQGFELRNFKTRKPYRVPMGIFVTGAGEQIVLRQNRIYGIKTRYAGTDGGDAHGIAVYGTRAPASLKNLVIEGNELYNLKLGSSEALVVNGNVEQFAITNNLIHAVNNIGIDAIGFEGTAPDPAYDQARDGSIAGNVVYNIDSSTNPAYGGERSAGCIYVDGGTRIVVERNIAHHCNLGIELASEQRGRATSYITLRNNFIYHNTEAGIAIGGYDRRRGRTEYCVIVNNTLYQNDTRQQGNGELYVQYAVRYNTIKNNLVFANSQGLYIGSWSRAVTGNGVNNNLYYAKGARGEWQWRGVSYDNFAAYQQATGNDLDSLNGVDPLLVNSILPDLHLQSTSPAIDAGVNLVEAGTLDIDGELRVQGNAIDMGGDEVK